MLEHQKLLLANLQNYPDLFAKELQKSVKWLSPEQVDELYIWLKKNFNQSFHQDAIKVFIDYSRATA
ncbi:MAG: hypothetical protein PHU27_06075 [Salinivirgaceae bacterium]|jgi:hypothetical protein|nr:hypothetical protein [Salinivirgaceae bacterium]MDD4747424.1 hypothetical protein [Salinivirgaceae bacterium]MDY0280737.1 hypothetical protein [Salinivirgaceae bacterium]